MLEWAAFTVATAGCRVRCRVLRAPCTHGWTLLGCMNRPAWTQINEDVLLGIFACCYAAHLQAAALYCNHHPTQTHIVHTHTHGHTDSSRVLWLLLFKRLTASISFICVFAYVQHFAAMLIQMRNTPQRNNAISLTISVSFFAICSHNLHVYVC